MAMHDPISGAVRHTPSINMDANLLAAAQTMVKNDISAVIVKNGEELVGILTDMDVMDSIVRHGNILDVDVASSMTACELILEDKSVSSPCAQLYEGESVKNALKTMNAAGVHNLLVSCEMGVGTCMVSIRDLLRLAIS